MEFILRSDFQGRWNDFPLTSLRIFKSYGGFGWRRSVKFLLYRNGFSPMILCLSKWNGDWSSPEGEWYPGNWPVMTASSYELCAPLKSIAPSWSQVKGVVWNEPYFFFFLPEILKLIVWHEHLNRVTRFQWHDRHQFIHSFSAPYPFNKMVNNFTCRQISWAFFCPGSSYFNEKFALSGHTLADFI